MEREIGRRSWASHFQEPAALGFKVPEFATGMHLISKCLRLLEVVLNMRWKRGEKNNDD